MDVLCASTGRLQFRMNQDGTGTSLFTVPTNTFAINQWYHVLWAWDYAAARFQLYVNGVAISTASYSFVGSTKFEMSGGTLTQVSVGSSLGANRWLGDIGHMWL